MIVDEMDLNDQYKLLSEFELLQHNNECVMFVNLGPCQQSCLRTKTYPRTVLGYILVLSRVNESVSS